MKYLALLSLTLAVARATPVKHSNPHGFDVSDYRPNVNLDAVVDHGIEFVYIKTTEGTPYISPSLNAQVEHSYLHGIDVSDYQPNVNLDAAVDNGIEFVYIKTTEGTSDISPSFNAQVKYSYPHGIDISAYQPNVNWNAVVNNGIKFVYIKATEGTSYISPSFNSQYTGATRVHLIRGAYHFALPNYSSGAEQAEFFLKHGGGWSPDGITLPGALDIEYNPYGPECYGLSAAEMVSWIKDFSNTYKRATHRYPVIYTTTDWWTTCAGNNPDFGNDNPLWIARYASEIGLLPHGWKYTSFWQYADSAGENPGDGDIWNGNYASLQKFARGG